MNIFCFFSYLQLFPLWLYYKVNMLLQTQAVMLFQMDMQRQSGKNFFQFMSNVYNRNLYYHRFKPYGHLFRIICPRISTLTMPRSSMGGGVLLQHPYNTIINAQYVGKRFTIFQNCTIGKNKSGTPHIGNNVIIYTGAIVVGGIYIGDNVSIGAGAVVTKNVPDNCVVIGNPAFIVRRNGVKVHESL